MNSKVCECVCVCVCVCTEWVVVGGAGQPSKGDKIVYFSKVLSAPPTAGILLSLRGQPAIGTVSAVCRGKALGRPCPLEALPSLAAPGFPKLGLRQALHTHTHAHTFGFAFHECGSA